MNLILLIAAIVLFILFALGAPLGHMSALGWGLVAFAASFLPWGNWPRIPPG